MISNKIFTSLSVCVIALTMIATSIAVGIVMSSMASTDLSLTPTQRFNNHEIKFIGTNEQALFNQNGTINPQVASDLVAALALAEVSSTNNDTWNPVNFWDAGAFSRGLLNSQETTRSAAIWVRLFPTINTSDANLLALSNLWFQVVFRSQGNGRDILTLYAVEPYIISAFGIDGNYNASAVRDTLARDYDALHEHFYTNFSVDMNYHFVTPNLLPGNWQSFRSQTDTHNDMFARSNSGASDFGRHADEAGRFSINNGMDGWDNRIEMSFDRGAGLGEWGQSGADLSTTDRLFLPSAFEAVFRGIGTETGDRFETIFESGVVPPLTGTHGHADSTLVSHVGALSSHLSAQNTNVRHGLWQLNGFDRAFHTDVTNSWLRSGVNTSETLARTISQVGMGAESGSHIEMGVRPAMHLDLRGLVTVRALNRGAVYNSSATIGDQSGRDITNVISPSRWGITTVTLNAGTGLMFGVHAITRETTHIQINGQNIVVDPGSQRSLQGCETLYRARFTDETQQVVVIELFNVDIRFIHGGFLIEATPVLSNLPVSGNDSDSRIEPVAAAVAFSTVVILVSTFIVILIMHYKPKKKEISK